MANPLPPGWTPRDVGRAAGTDELARELTGTPDRPFLAEAVRLVREFYAITPDEMSDDQVARLYVTLRAELALAVADVRQRIIGTGPGRHARALLVRLAELLARFVRLVIRIRQRYTRERAGQVSQYGRRHER